MLPGRVGFEAGRAMQSDFRRPNSQRSDCGEGNMGLSRATDLPPARLVRRIPQLDVSDRLTLSFNEIAVIWILHHGTSSRAQQSLDEQIVDFYPAALKAMSREERLRGAKQSDLRLIYFKGLIMAKTHSTRSMIDAIRRAEQVLARASATGGPAEVAPSEDQDTLSQIAEALDQPFRSPQFTTGPSARSADAPQWRR